MKQLLCIFIFIFISVALLSQENQSGFVFKTHSVSSFNETHTPINSDTLTARRLRIKDISGLVYVKNKLLREQLIEWVKSDSVTREEFDYWRKKVQEKADYREECDMFIVKLTDENAYYIEIEPIESKSLSFKIPKKSKKKSYDYIYPSNIEIDMFVFDVFDDDSDEKDKFNMGMRIEFEQQYIRLFAGVEYELTLADKQFLRLGSGLSREGVFQFNFSTGYDGASWRMSSGDLSQNLVLQPDHLYASLLLRNSLFKADLLLKNQSLRLSYGYEKVENAFNDSLRLNSKKELQQFRAAYSLSFLDDFDYPLSGFYLNAKYLYSDITEKEANIPYVLANDYNQDYSKYGTYHKALSGSIHGLIALSESSAIHLSVKGFKDDFDISNFTNGITLANLQLIKQERYYTESSIGIRKRIDDDEMFILRYGLHELYLDGKIKGKVNDYFIEARYIHNGFEMKYSYVFGMKNRQSNLPNIESYMHHRDGFLLSFGLNIGAL